MSANSTPGRPGGKSMSSGLLTMKFMRRAAAASPVISPSTPSTPEGPPLKRRKQIDGEDTIPFDVKELANQAKIRAVMEQEAAKQQALMDKVAAEAGESRWVLNFQDSEDGQRESTSMKVVQMGFADVDRRPENKTIKSEEEQEQEDEILLEQSLLTGRRSFGKFNRTIEKLQNPNAEDSSSSSSEDEKNQSEPDDFSDADGTDALIKEEKALAIQKLKDERKKQKKKDKKELERLAEARKRKDVNLNGLTSLSNAGSGGGKKPFDKSTSTCYRCQKVGHFASECPNGRSSGIQSDVRVKKSRNSY